MKVLYVATVSNTINKFLIPHIKTLIDQGYKVDVACNINSDIHKALLGTNCRIYNVEFQRTPYNISNYKAYKKIRHLLKEEKYDVVHTHTPVASAIIRLITKKATNIKVIYTAHGFHFYSGASLKNWLTYYPVEVYLSRFTDLIITINKEDYYRAKNKLFANNVKYFPGVGIDVERIKGLKIDINKKREELAIKPQDSFILSIGELNANKNHEVVIKAVSIINDPNLKYVICGRGPLEKHLKELVKSLNVENQVLFLGYRNDVYELCRAADLFVFPSLREGLPVSIMEAMVSGLPVICSDIRGNADLVTDEHGGYLVKDNSTEEYVNKINELLHNKEKRVQFSEFNKVKVEEFSLDNVLSLLKEVY